MLGYKFIIEFEAEFKTDSRTARL